MTNSTALPITQKLSTSDGSQPPSGLHSHPVFGPLRREWDTIATTRQARRAFRIWRAADPTFEMAESAGDAVAKVTNAPLKADRYAMTRALLIQAGTCVVAERALLQAHAPAACALSKRARGWTGERLSVSYGLVTEMRAGSVSSATWTDLDAIAVSASAEWIATKRGESIPMAGMKMRDHVRNRLRSFVWSELRRTNAELIVAARPAVRVDSSSNELIEVLRAAHQEDLLTAAEMRLIIGNRILGLTDREVGVREFVSPATANRMRSRVEKKLVTALSS